MKQQCRYFVSQVRGLAMLLLFRDFGQFREVFEILIKIEQ